MNRRNSAFKNLLTNWYWLLGAGLILLVCTALSLAIRPVQDADGSYSTRPLGFTGSLENKALDLLFQIRNSTQPQFAVRGTAEPITLVEVDELTIKRSGIRLQKWPRSFYAQLIDRASQGGATVIGLDVFLSEKGGSTDEDLAADQALVSSINNAGNVVLVKKLPVGGYPAIDPLPMFSDAAYTVGFVDLPLDDDGYVRSSQLFRTADSPTEQISFATRLAEAHELALSPESSRTLKAVDSGQVAFGEQVLPLRPDGNLQIDFRGRPTAFKRISAGDLLFGDNSSVPEDLFRDRIVLIGASNIDAPDLFLTPFYEPNSLLRLFDRTLPASPIRMPGVEIHANIAGTLLFGKLLKRPSFVFQVLFLGLTLAVAGFAILWLRGSLALLVVLGVALAALILSVYQFNTHASILPLATAWLGLVVLTPSGLGLRYAREKKLREESEAERLQVMDIFSRFVSNDVAVKVWEQRGKTSIEGETRIVTIVFTDIRNFTTLSEEESSETVVTWLNDYFERMSAIVEANGGHINKYIGDGLLIVFGAPIDRGPALEANAAVSCAIAMLEDVDKLAAEWEGTGRPEIKIGIGIHTGSATCGVIGAERRLEYTVIGDTVNLAARLESTTKEFGVPLLLSEATAELVSERFNVREAGEVTVKGKTKATRVFTVATSFVANGNVETADAQIFGKP